MAVKEINGLVQYKDGNGDVNIIYPVTKAENVEGLDKKADENAVVKYEDILLKENPFGAKEIYISKLDNFFGAASKRYTVKIKIYNSDDTLYQDLSASAYTIFNGDYNNFLIIPSGKYMIVTITLDADLLSTSNSEYIFSFYSYNIPLEVTGRAKSRNGNEDYQWYNLNVVGNIADQSSGYSIFVLRNSYNYNTIEYEFKISAKEDIHAYLTQIEGSLKRSNSTVSYPVLTKYYPETLYFPLTLPGNPTESKHAVTKEYVDGLVDKSKPTYISDTMSASKWDKPSKTYSFESSYPSASYDIEIQPSDACTELQFEAWSKSRVVGSISKNIAKAIGDVPTIDIPIILKAVKK